MNTLSPASRLVGLGFYVGICIAACTIGGLQLDKWLDTGRILTLVGLAVGLVLAIWGGVLQLQEVLAEIERRRLEGKQKE